MKDLETIKNVISDIVGFDICTNRHNRNEAYARFIYYKLARELTTKTFSNIGKIVNRDHATVLYGIKTFDILLSQDSFIEKTYIASILKLKSINGLDNFIMKEELKKFIENEDIYS